jgi:hypothetical protein
MTQITETPIFMLGNKLYYQKLERDLLRLRQGSRTQTNPYVEQVCGIYQEWEALRETVKQLLAAEFNSSPVYFEQFGSQSDLLNPLAADHRTLAELIVQIEGHLEIAQHSGKNRLSAYKNYLEALDRFSSVTLAHIGR